MNHILLVTDNPDRWPFDIPSATVVTARQYLTDPQVQHLRNCRIFNICRHYRYQSAGYYVSLLAEARGHRPIPKITTLQDLKTSSIYRNTSAASTPSSRNPSPPSSPTPSPSPSISPKIRPSAINASPTNSSICSPQKGSALYYDTFYTTIPQRLKSGQYPPVNPCIYWVFGLLILSTENPVCL
jgi:hypothetical protein